VSAHSFESFESFFEITVLICGYFHFCVVVCCCRLLLLIFLHRYILNLCHWGWAGDLDADEDLSSEDQGELEVTSRHAHYDEWE
jgi:hypothetical protein